MSEEIANALQRGVEEDLVPAAKDVATSVENAIHSVADGAETVAREGEANESAVVGKLASVTTRDEPSLPAGGGAATAPSRISSVLSPQDVDDAAPSPSSLLHNDDGIPGASRDTKRLGTLAEGDVTRDEQGLITHVGGQPADEYLNSLSEERAGVYRAAKDDGSLPRGQQGNCIATGLDRRTGAVYEGVNGPRADVVDPGGLHPTLQANVDALQAKGPYTWRDGTTGNQNPFHDELLGHAEVKATNQALMDRDAANLPSGKDSLGELMMAPYMPFIKGGMPAPFCPNCDGVLDGVVSTTGRLTE